MISRSIGNPHPLSPRVLLASSPWPVLLVVQMPVHGPGLPSFFCRRYCTSIFIPPHVPEVRPWWRRKKCASSSSSPSLPPNTIDRYGQRASVCVRARVYARRCRRRRRSGRLTEEARGIAKIVAGRKKKEGRGTRSTCSVSFPRRYCPPDVEIVIRYSILVARRVRVVTEEISLRRGLRRKKEMGRRRRGGETR